MADSSYSDVLRFGEPNVDPCDIPLNDEDKMPAQSPKPLNLCGRRGDDRFAPQRKVRYQTDKNGWTIVDHARSRYQKDMRKWRAYEKNIRLEKPAVRPRKPLSLMKRTKGLFVDPKEVVGKHKIHAAKKSSAIDEPKASQSTSSKRFAKGKCGTKPSASTHICIKKSLMSQIKKPARSTTHRSVSIFFLLLVLSIPSISLRSVFLLFKHHPTQQ